ncbi:MAG: tRNA (guanosine(37)-N1)-methyltransferase TrmD, partial [Coriobacteriia bacterium]|nr:tRNA (guanosine(37)-N1)-methyltransferase TrmD [Coriobacteriia bacterium]
MRVDVVTIFPDMFAAPMSASIVGIARDRHLLELHVHDLRDWAHDPHRTTDDYSYGGGPGMVMKPEPIFGAVRHVTELAPEKPYSVFLTPAGRRMDQPIAQELATRDRLLLVCGRYEGFDERAYALADLRLSIGDYVLSGGEIPAMVVIETVARLLPGVLGHDESAIDESFAAGL